MSDLGDNFTTASKMIPIENVREITKARECANKKKGCNFNTHVSWYWCTCCMMLKAIGSDFFLLQKRLEILEGPNFMWKMTDWQRDQYEKQHAYWERWCDNYPRGATMNT